MRLWHVGLIKGLPDQQLKGQWRELSAIAGAVNKNGTPNHLLVNKIEEFSYNEWAGYAYAIRKEMFERNMNPKDQTLFKILSINYDYFKDINSYQFSQPIFKEWHNERYLRQCLSNLEEKFDCGGLTIVEWNEVLLTAEDWRSENV